MDDLSITSWHTYCMDVVALPDLDQLDIEALKALVVAQSESLDSHTTGGTSEAGRREAAPHDLQRDERKGRYPG